MSVTVTRVRTPEQIASVRALVWEFFDVLRARYPDMHDEIDAYIAQKDIAGQLGAFAEHFLPPAGECFLGLQDGTPVGMVMMMPKGEGDGEVNRMYVRDAARGQGLGRKLALAVVDEARQRGMGALWLDALYRHVEAIPLYESLGFVRYTDPDAFGAGDDRIIHMKLSL
ncbi:GNAT family N-acetyltransferase [Palleronia sp. KMU-117]|uniref:GNAT family N-acetyltransferase n=1 Tax=Palleronia sp. KMU-117 TaxID=3434108 RepID=UPI003D7240BA